MRIIGAQYLRGTVPDRLVFRAPHPQASVHAPIAAQNVDDGYKSLTDTALGWATWGALTGGIGSDFGGGLGGGGDFGGGGASGGW